MNSTTWCNLFSTASKYNISVQKSRYQLLLYAGIATIFILVAMVFLTYAYHQVLVIAIVAVLLISLFRRSENNQQQSILTFELTSQGQCLFDDQTCYQIQASSRQSFLGCWLVLQLLPNNQVFSNAKNSNPNRLLFIFRDSLSSQDFSRLSNVITQRHYQS